MVPRNSTFPGSSVLMSATTTAELPATESRSTSSLQGTFLPLNTPGKKRRNEKSSMTLNAAKIKISQVKGSCGNSRRNSRESCRCGRGSQTEKHDYESRNDKLRHHKYHSGDQPIPESIHGKLLLAYQTKKPYFAKWAIPSATVLKLSPLTSL